MTERLEERLRRAARTYRMLGNHSGEVMFIDAADTVTELRTENDRLRELVAKMARALGVDSEWCHRECEREFGCDCEPCPLDKALLELGIEV